LGKLFETPLKRTKTCASPLFLGGKTTIPLKIKNLKKHNSVQADNKTGRGFAQFLGNSKKVKKVVESV
jgi:hypothetical protein